MLTSPGFFFLEKPTCPELIDRSLRLVQKYAHVYSAVPCWPFYMHIYEDTILQALSPLIIIRILDIGILKVCELKMNQSQDQAVPLFSPFLKQALVFTCLQYKSLENTVGKGEIARYVQFFPFLTVFSTCLENFLQFSSNLKLPSANSLRLEESKICRLGKV